MIKRIFLFPLLSVLLCYIIPVNAQSITLPSAPAYHDASLDTFIADLKSIIATRDTGRLMVLVDPRSKLTFGDQGADAKGYFRDRWKPGSKQSGIWGTLTRLLSFGPSVDSLTGTVWFPYLFSLDLSQEAEIADVYLVSATGVCIRQRPDISSPTVGRVGGTIVYHRNDRTHLPACTDPAHTHYYSQNLNYDWVPVTTRDHKIKGFIYWQYVYHPFDYRMAVERRDGRWRITTLVNGD